MPVHDWTQVDAGIFHAFHHRWITAISDALNDGLLPPDYYALPEQIAGGVIPDVLTLEFSHSGGGGHGDGKPAGGTMLATEPIVELTDEAGFDHYVAKQKAIAVRHVTGDRVVAVIEIVSPGNKSSASAMWALTQKASELLQGGVHLLVIDLFPPSSRDPQGVHAAIWDHFSGRAYTLPDGKTLTVAAYESAMNVKTYVRAFNVGDSLPTMPLYLRAGGFVKLALESTYANAFSHMPGRWQQVLAASRP